MNSKDVEGGRGETAQLFIKNLYVKFDIDNLCNRDWNFWHQHIRTIYSDVCNNCEMPMYYGILRKESIKNQEKLEGSLYFERREGFK